MPTNVSVPKNFLNITGSQYVGYSYSLYTHYSKFNAVQTAPPKYRPIGTR